MGSHRPRNVGRYREETDNGNLGMGVMLLRPREGEMGISNPIATIHVQGIESGISDGLILWEFSRYGPVKCYSRWWDIKLKPNGGWSNSFFIEYFSGIDAERAVIEMHGRSLIKGGQDIEVELTELFLTTNRKACHAGTDVFRRPQVQEFVYNLLKIKAENWGNDMMQYVPTVPEVYEELKEV